MKSVDNMIIETTYKISSGEWQTGFAFQSPEEFVDFFSAESVYGGAEFRVSVDPEDVPKLIAAIRKGRDMSQSQLGRNMESTYDRHVIGQIERGQRKLGLKTIDQIAKALSLEVKIQFTGIGQFVEIPPNPADFDGDINPGMFENE